VSRPRLELGEGILRKSLMLQDHKKMGSPAKRDCPLRCSESQLVVMREKGSWNFVRFGGGGKKKLSTRDRERRMNTDRGGKTLAHQKALHEKEKIRIVLTERRKKADNVTRRGKRYVLAL